MTTLSVIIPALNEQDGITAIIDRTLAVRPDLKEVGLELELLIVDDGSTDRTADIVRGYGSQVRLIQHEVNKGYGAAIKTGFQTATGEWLAFLDADGTYPPEAFPAMYEAALREEADLVIGSRMAGTESEMPLVRRVGNVFFAGLVSFVGKTNVTDSASGQRILRREALEKLYPLPDGLNFTPVMSTRALHEDIKMIEVPIVYHERKGRSKLNPVKDGLRFLKTIVWTGLSYNPVRLFGFVGGLGVLFAALVGAALVLIRATGSTYVSPLGSFVLFFAVVSAVVGMSVFTFGATLNYLAGLMRGKEVKLGLFGRPIFEPSLDHHFGWMGLVSVAAGVVVSVLALAANVGVSNPDFANLFFYFLGSAMFIMIGVQLIVSWVLMRVLEEMSKRKHQAQKDLGLLWASPTNGREAATEVHITKQAS